MLESAESDHPRLTNREIIFEEFQPMGCTIHQRHRARDRQTICDRKTALCTIVHRAVKMKLADRRVLQSARSFGSKVSR